MQGFFLHVILPLKLAWTPTYRSDVPCRLGQRVLVKLGTREYIAVVCATDVVPDIDESRIQSLVAHDCGLPDISEAELKLWKFISDYYLCSIGEVYKAAYPTLKLRSEVSSASALERLRQRLAKKEADLLKKHNARVMARLTGERDALVAQIQAFERRPSAAGAKEKHGAKPLVIIGSTRCGEYVTRIREALNEGGQVLVLTPEIAFCENMERLLKPVFDDALRIFNSTVSAVQRRRMADDIRDGEPCVVLGTRVSVFLPFSKLALVIIDDEQDSSYKQMEPAPRYNARDVATALGSIHGAQVILGTDSPSLETLYNVEKGRYTMLAASTPADCGDSCEIVDINAERRKNGMLGCLSRKLLAAMADCSQPIVLVRRWEKTEELQDELKKYIPERSDIRIMSMQELKSEGTHGAAMIAVLQADAFISKDDFRADERAIQLKAMLCALAPQVVIQTASGERFSNARSTQELLAERREFGFPPFTRIVEIRQSGTGQTMQRFFLRKDASLAAEKRKIASSVTASCYVDVDPA